MKAAAELEPCVAEQGERVLVSGQVSEGSRDRKENLSPPGGAGAVE